MLTTVELAEFWKLAAAPNVPEGGVVGAAVVRAAPARPTGGHGGIEATAFHRLCGEAWRGLADEARALAAFLADRQPQVYRRYDRW
jgi:hypothetical protein